MNELLYVLEPYHGLNTRYYCPKCKQKTKTFVRYINTRTNEHLNSSVGRCNREIKCGYHYSPSQYFKDNHISLDTNNLHLANKLITTENKANLISFINQNIFKASLKVCRTNNFVMFLKKLFGEDIANFLVQKYCIGTSIHWNGATVFWEIDSNGKIRTGKIMLYNELTGKRIKKPFNHISWVHTVLKLQNFNLKQCFFGEHLLHEKHKPVAIVESEKTAIIASIYLPNFIWLAVGSLTNLNKEKCNILKGRSVILFPDLNGFEKWSVKAKEFSHIANFIVSDLLERKANNEEKEQGLDLADYLIRHEYKAFVI